MSKILFELPDRYVLDTGEVAEKHIRALRAVLAGQSLNGMILIDSADIQRFASEHKQTPVLWNEGPSEQPSPETRVWQIPDHYKTLNLEKTLAECLLDYDDVQKLNAVTINLERYASRLREEIDLVQARGMDDFIRTLIYIVSMFRNNNVVWGVGRGSSVESLVLFLIGVHRIDPILYDIPLEHFFRTK